MKKQKKKYINVIYIIKIIEVVLLFLCLIKHVAMENSALCWGERSDLCPGCFTPRERTFCRFWTGDWVGPRANLDVVAKRKLDYSAGIQIPLIHVRRQP
jgi:hypothetical protein